ncbi:MAG: YHS domain-containing protein [Betaproteobacteria bacterium]|nr:YHS domain-containing protein [Betaproteobacteria bacterium]
MTRLSTTVLGVCFALGIQISPTAAQRITPVLADVLQRGGHVLVLRHTTAERVKEPSPMDLADCASQHRLTDKGRDEARALGQAFRTLKIPVGSVLSSDYCRTMETARLAFGRTESAEVLLHPAYTPPAGVPPPAPYAQRMELLKRLLATPPAPGTNTVLVSHGENIKDAVGFAVAFGEVVIFRPDGAGGTGLAGRVLASGWFPAQEKSAGAEECLKTGCPAGERAVHEINQTPDGIAIQGFDAVAYHTEGRAVNGHSNFEYSWKDARWRFASAANRDRFAADPERYAPQHGGYCNMAMTKDQVKAGDPNAWAVIDGKLRLYASTKGRDNFQKNTAANVDLAARNWQNLKPAK